MKNIGIDIDDTIAETSLVANKYLKKFDNSYQDYHELPKEEYYEFLNLYLEDIVKNGIAKKHVKEVFDYLHEHHYRIIIITARNSKYVPNMKRLTQNFFDKNHLIYDKIEFDDQNLEDKSIQAIENQIDLFIDDKESVLDKVSAVGIECIRFTKEKNSKYQTFNNWKDILEYIKRKEGNNG